MGHCGAFLSQSRSVMYLYVALATNWLGIDREMTCQVDNGQHGVNVFPKGSRNERYEDSCVRNRERV